MKLILVPTDFSRASENAIDYAVALNHNLKADIILLHTYYIPVPTSEASIVVPDNTLRKEAIRALEELKNKYQDNYPGIRFSIELTEGFPVSEILSAEKQLKPDLIIMGTHGMNVVKRFLMGNTTSSVIEKSNCPVISIPEDAEFRHMNKIVFAANYGEDDFANVYDLVKFARQYNAEIILLHVSTGNLDKSFDYNQLDNFKNRIVEESGYKSISLKLLEEKNVYDGINLYLKEVNADMFSVSMRNRTFLQSVFRPGLTKKMIYHSDIPAMVFHTEY